MSKKTEIYARRVREGADILQQEITDRDGVIVTLRERGDKYKAEVADLEHPFGRHMTFMGFSMSEIEDRLLEVKQLRGANSKLKAQKEDFEHNETFLAGSVAQLKTKLECTKECLKFSQESAIRRSTRCVAMSKKISKLLTEVEGLKSPHKIKRGGFTAGPSYESLEKQLDDARDTHTHLRKLITDLRRMASDARVCLHDLEGIVG